MLKRVSIQNFKSLKDVTLDLQKVNLLIGPNNSGKTNFLKALESFSFGGLQPQNVESLQALSYKRRKETIIYDFDYLPNPTGYMAINHLNKDVILYKCSQFTKFTENDYQGVFIENVFNEGLEGGNGESLPSIPTGGYRVEFYEFVKTIIFRPDPSKLIQKAKFSADEVYLLPDCSNLIAFYFYVDANFKRNSQRIQKDLSVCIPEIAYFTVPPVKVGSESFLGLQFFDREENSYWANEMSEGVLYFLALLCIIHQPNPPKLLLLEEPEKGIHPRRIFEVIQFIFRLAEEKDVQVIMTTHSPIVVDMFKDMPESVFIFDKDEEGATHVKNLLHDVIEPETVKSEELGIEPPHYTDSLGDAWTVGFLGGVPK